MLVLFETAAGYALFDVDKSKLTDGDLHALFKTPEKANETVKLRSFHKFDDTVEVRREEGDGCRSSAAHVSPAHGSSPVPSRASTQALAAATSLTEGKMDKALKSFLKKNIVEAGLKEKLAVSDAKVGGVVKEKLGIKCVSDGSVNELMRGIRSQLNELITGRW